MAVVTRRAAPVDAVGGLACGERPELPERFTRPGLPAAVDAVGGGGGDAPRLDGDAGQAAREVKGIGGLPRSGRPLRLVENPDLDHQILPQPILLTSLRISPSTVSPSARAAKVSAMRCFSTGPARATTSSSEGARRPWMRARARTASMSD